MSKMLRPRAWNSGNRCEYLGTEKAVRSMALRYLMRQQAQCLSDLTPGDSDNPTRTELNHAELTSSLSELQVLSRQTRHRRSVSIHHFTLGQVCHPLSQPPSQPWRPKLGSQSQARPNCRRELAWMSGLRKPSSVVTSQSLQ